MLAEPLFHQAARGVADAETGELHGGADFLEGLVKGLLDPFGRDLDGELFFAGSHILGLLFRQEGFLFDWGGGFGRGGHG